MENTASEMMRNYVNSQKFSSTAEIMEAMKNLFRDALQQVMESELEETLTLDGFLNFHLNLPFMLEFPVQ